MAKLASVILFLALVTLVSGQTPDYVKKGYNPPPLSGATTCTKGIAGNTPATCPYPTVPRTDEGKDGSTVCFTAVNGQAYEGVFSLTYPSSAIPGCTSNSDCGTNPGVLCGTNGPTGVPNTCFPLAPSGCPFTPGDATNGSTTTSAGRKLML